MQSLNLYRVNLPRWGLKRKIAKLLNRQRLCVNLPRWGLKRDPIAQSLKGLGVNLPRWGLKQLSNQNISNILKCKFTPLGFETIEDVKGYKTPEV